jgi:hypothetical protein
MDNYPENLKPRFDAGGAVEEPFREWWPKVKANFPSVPENVAQYWLHEHWSHSPYSFLPSKDYRFDLVSWPSQKLFEARSTWNRFVEDNAECVEHGHDLVEEWHMPEPYRTVAYMLEHHDFPAPLIILDNRDGHVVPEFEYQAIPSAYVLMEGHRRFNIALYLQTAGRLNPHVNVWLMTKIPA